MRVHVCVLGGPGVQNMFLLFLREETIARGLVGAIGPAHGCHLPCPPPAGQRAWLLK